MTTGGAEKALAQALQSARKTAGLTQQELCHKAGLSYSTLAKIERGAIRAPSIFTIHQIATVLGVTLDQLVGSALPALPPQTSKKVTKNGVRFIYFDINGCLVSFFNRAFTQIAHDSGQQVDVIETAFWHYDDAACRGELSMTEYNKILGQRFGLPDFDWEAYYLAAIEPIAEMHELVTWAAEHYRVGLLTNIFPGQVSDLMKKALIPSLAYDVILASSDVGTVKPEPEIYQIATEKAGVAAGEILLVDDSRPNIMAAEKAGWKVLWFDNYRLEESVARVRAALEPADDV